MTPSELLTEAFSRVPETVERAVDGLSEDQLAARPAAGANTLAWLAWHIARGQDVQIAELAGSGSIVGAADRSFAELAASLTKVGVPVPITEGAQA